MDSLKISVSDQVKIGTPKPKVIHSPYFQFVVMTEIKHTLVLQVTNQANAPSALIPSTFPMAT